jgi:hypothetical protein
LKVGEQGRPASLRRGPPLFILRSTRSFIVVGLLAGVYLGLSRLIVSWPENNGPYSRAGVCRLRRQIWRRSRGRPSVRVAMVASLLIEYRSSKFARTAPQQHGPPLYIAILLTKRCFFGRTCSTLNSAVPVRCTCRLRDATTASLDCDVFETTPALLSLVYPVRTTLLILRSGHWSAGRAMKMQLFESCQADTMFPCCQLAAHKERLEVGTATETLCRFSQHTN